MDDEIMELLLFAASDDSSDDDAAVMFNNMNRAIAIQMMALQSKETHCRTYKYRQRQEGAEKLWQDYFAENPTYTNDGFRKRFRMRRGLFNRILNALQDANPYFVQKRDALGNPGLSGHQKMTAALSTLTFGRPADALDEYVRIGETTVIETVKKFCKSIIQIFGDQYLRNPTPEDVSRLLQQNATRGFPGMLGSLDCMHWRWKNCPTAWQQGQYKRQEWEPIIILEAIASYDLWIWHAFFEMPGCHGDLNVLDKSDLFDNLSQGITPPVNVSVNGHDYESGYFVADGIYPPLPTVVQSFREPENQKKRRFTEMQEIARKDVERAINVLQARFTIVNGPARLWSPDQLHYIFKTCIILHNMIVEDERNEPNWDYVYDVRRSESVDICRDKVASRYDYMKPHVPLHDFQNHQQLQSDLIEHIWTMYGA